MPSTVLLRQVNLLEGPGLPERRADVLSAALLERIDAAGG
jgi:hypothetical protein